MNTPPEIKIGGLVWKVRNSIDMANGENAYGSTHLVSQTIFLDPAMSLQKRENVFIHEVLHAIWDTFGLKSAGFTRDQEEQIVTALSNGLYQVVKDNKIF